MEFELKTTEEIARVLAERVREIRLRNKWKRFTLAQRSGVTESSLRRFEQTAKISLENFLKLMTALGRLDEMDQLLKHPVALSIDDLEKRNTKPLKRGTV
jgi:transcriptional regulator with XRE-family HTH domain